MPKKITQEEFIEKARKVHGDKYDYSKVEYVNSNTKVRIICPIHGEFLQTPCNHLNGQTCYKCSRESKRTKIFNVGINDMKTSYDDKIYDIWYGMLSRCYNPKSSSYKNYSNVEVCEEWLCFSNFNDWYKRYGVEGWDIDKDLFSTENKIYSPKTCCLLPNELNLFFKNKKGEDIDLPHGVYRSNQKFRCSLYPSSFKSRVSFDTIEEALVVYNKARRERIRFLAEKYKDKLEKRVYLKLLKI